jgi:hypothetical protein
MVQRGLGTTAINVTVAPDTVQTFELREAKLTGSPEDAVALTVNGAVPNSRFGSAPNVIVCGNCTWKAPSERAAHCNIETPLTRSSM